MANDNTGHDTHMNIPFLSIKPSVMVQWEAWSPWTHGTMVKYGSEEHSGRSFKIQVMKTRHNITKMKSHVKPTPVKAKKHIRNEMMKGSTLQVADRCKELVNE